MNQQAAGLQTAGKSQAPKAPSATEQTIGLTINASWQDKLELIKAMYPNAKAADLELFFHQAQRMGLDPLCRQIHLVTRVKRKKVGDAWVNDGYTSAIQVGIDGYRAIADRTGVCAGNDDPLFDEGLTQFQFEKADPKRAQPVTATCTVYKIIGGLRCPFTATATWSAYAPKSGDGEFMWKKMPLLMLAKCAEALALRKAFPAELSGVYTDAEMHQAGPGIKVIEGSEVKVNHVDHAEAEAPKAAPVAPVQPKARPADVPNQEALTDIVQVFMEATTEDEMEKAHNRFAEAYKTSPATVALAWDAFQKQLTRLRGKK